MKKQIALMLMMTASSASYASSELTSDCKQTLLESLKYGEIQASANIERETGGNLAPFVGVVCSNGTINETRIDQQTVVVELSTNPYYGPTKRLTVRCTEAPISEYPRLQITVKSTESNQCELTITKIRFKFDLND